MYTYCRPFFLQTNFLGPQRTALGNVSVTPKVIFWLCYSPAPPFSSSRKKKRAMPNCPTIFPTPNHCDSTCVKREQVASSFRHSVGRFKIGRGRSHQILSIPVRAKRRGNPASPNAVWASGVDQTVLWVDGWLAVSLLFITLSHQPLPLASPSYFIWFFFALKKKQIFWKSKNLVKIVWKFMMEPIEGGIRKGHMFFVSHRVPKQNISSKIYAKRDPSVSLRAEYFKQRFEHLDPTPMGSTPRYNYIHPLKLT